MSNFYEEKELQNLGFKFIGENCKISKLSSFYNKKNISIGNNTRIDDFCVISAGEGGIIIGNNTHISTHVTICGKSSIKIGDYCCASFKSTISSNCDDFTLIVVILVYELIVDDFFVAFVVNIPYPGVCY